MAHMYGRELDGEHVDPSSSKIIKFLLGAE